MPHNIFHQVKFKSRWNSNSIQICSCEFCYDGNFINCDDRITGPKGWFHMVRNPFHGDFDNSDASDFGEFDD